MGPNITEAHQEKVTEAERKASVLFGIGFLFFVSNVPRILLNLHEVIGSWTFPKSTSKTANNLFLKSFFCLPYYIFGFPKELYVATSATTFLLVYYSTFNGFFFVGFHYWKLQGRREKGMWQLTVLGIAFWQHLSTLIDGQLILQHFHLFFHSLFCIQSGLVRKHWILFWSVLEYFQVYWWVFFPKNSEKFRKIPKNSEKFRLNLDFLL